MRKRTKRDKNENRVKPGSNTRPVKLVRDRAGHLLIVGVGASGIDWDRIVDNMRDERIREIARR